MDFIYTSFSTDTVRVGFWLTLILSIFLCIMGLAMVAVPAYFQIQKWRNSDYDELPDPEEREMNRVYNRSYNSSFMKSKSGNWDVGRYRSGSGDHVVDEEGLEGDGAEAPKS